MTTDKDKANHAKFVKHLRQSKRAVKLIAGWLVERGHEVEILESTEAKTRRDFKRHQDDGDLRVDGERVEVKRLGVIFTGPDDWPYRGHYIVCAQHTFDRASPKPVQYIHCSGDMECVGIVDVKRTLRHWYVESRSDRRYVDESQRCYLIPLSLVQFVATGIELPRKQSRPYCSPHNDASQWDYAEAGGRWRVTCRKCGAFIGYSAAPSVLGE